MTSHFLDRVVQRPLRSQSLTLQAPACYPDVQMMSLIVPVSRAAAGRLLPSPRLRPLALSPSLALAAIHCFEYRDTPVGHYNEVSLSIAVQLDAPRRLPSNPCALLQSALQHDFHGYVVALPVNTELARVAGVEVFGYPKFLADIRFSQDATTRCCRVTNPQTGALLLAVRGARLNATPPSRPWFSRKDRSPHGPGRHITHFSSYPTGPAGLKRAVMHVNALSRAVSYVRGASLDLGLDPRGAALRALAPGPPLQYVYVPRAEAVLEAPTRISVSPTGRW